MAMQPTGPATPPPAADPAADPSMEDILASIRRILNEDEAPKPPLEPHEPGQIPDKGVLVLDSSMMVPEPSRDTPSRDPSSRDAPPRDTSSRDASPRDVPQPKSPAERPAILEHPVVSESEPTVSRAPSSPQQPATAAAPPGKPAAPSNARLVAPEAAAAAGASVDALMRTLASERSTAVHRGGPTIEDLVRAEIRPLLKDWLDNHLPPLVERLVRAEIERVVGRMAP